MVNKQGQTRLASYYEWQTIEERSTLEAEVIRKCLSRTENQCSFMEYRGMRIVYRRYASLFFIVGVEQDEEVRRRIGRERREALCDGGGGGAAAMWCQKGSDAGLGRLREDARARPRRRSP